MNELNFKFDSLDAGTQFKILDRMMERIRNLSTKQVEKEAMVSVVEIIYDETRIALAENSGPCDECGMEAETMEWQEFDQNFICDECGNVQYAINAATP
ncbi:hypothetical protein LCGC14_2240210 [marine sediment metagenome]|uniref:Uncharacterized protein n=1 Tax=marine sediment metagenome TaxID=412755 RepID=A0A0F9FI85_9ZZZZ